MRLERIHFRSTSTLDIQAELRQRELLALAYAPRRGAVPRRPTRAGFRLFGGRRR